jgi:hypothetical protein
LEIEKLKTENDAKKFQTLLNEYTKERVIFFNLDTLHSVLDNHWQTADIEGLKKDYSE